jgi:SLOG in TRPM, prokaryote
MGITEVTNKGIESIAAQSLLTADARQKMLDMGKPFRLKFSNDHEADAIIIANDETLSLTLQNLQLSIPTTTLVIVGGAAGLSSDYLEQLQQLFTNVICPIAQSLNLCVIDGGTNVGIMHLLGQGLSNLLCQGQISLGILPSNSMANRFNAGFQSRIGIVHFLDKLLMAR